MCVTGMSRQAFIFIWKSPSFSKSFATGWKRAFGQRNPLLQIILAFSLLLAGCIAKPPAGNGNESSESFSVKLAIQGGLAHYAMHETLLISGNGSVERERQLFGNKTSRNISLSEEELEEFRQLVLNSDVFNFSSEYRCSQNCPADFPTISLQFNLSGKTKTVSLYATQDVPPALSEILAKISEFGARFGSEEGQFCGGTGNITCAQGLLCVPDPSRPDRSGMCLKENRSCVGLCGDGICQVIVCMAIGCPCAESRGSCPQDCR